VEVRSRSKSLINAMTQPSPSHQSATTSCWLQHFLIEPLDKLFLESVQQAWVLTTDTNTHGNNKIPTTASTSSLLKQWKGLQESVWAKSKTTTTLV